MSEKIFILPNLSMAAIDRCQLRFKFPIMPHIVHEHHKVALIDDVGDILDAGLDFIVGEGIAQPDAPDLTLHRHVPRVMYVDLRQSSVEIGREIEAIVVDQPRIQREAILEVSDSQRPGVTKVCSDHRVSVARSQVF